jgi:hypothetical protein
MTKPTVVPPMLTVLCRSSTRSIVVGSSVVAMSAWPDTTALARAWASVITSKTMVS